jgi:uncharacterized protein
MTEKWQEDSEYMSYVADLLETEAVKKLANFVQHMNSTPFRTFHQRFLLQL